MLLYKCLFLYSLAFAGGGKIFVVKAMEESSHLAMEKSLLESVQQSATHEYNGGTNTAKGWSFVPLTSRQETTSHELSRFGVQVPKGQVLDTTEGIGAFFDIRQNFIKHSVNIDIGGGQFDDHSEWLWKELKVTNLVLDPFQRSQQHNHEILSRIPELNPSSVSLMSVLNVIQEKNERLKVLNLARDILSQSSAATKKVFIKIWEGDALGKGRKTASGFQMNQLTEFYIQEVRQVFPNAKVEPQKKFIHVSI